MKAKNVIKEFGLDQIDPTTDLTNFLTYFHEEAFLKSFMTTDKSFENFKRVLDSTRIQWDAISIRIFNGIPERYWKYYYVRFIVPMRDELYPFAKFNALLKKLKTFDISELNYSLVCQIIDYYDTNKDKENFFASSTSKSFQFIVDAFLLTASTTESKFDKVCNIYKRILKYDPKRMAKFVELIKSIKTNVKFYNEENILKEKEEENGN